MGRDTVLLGASSRNKEMKYSTEWVFEWSCQYSTSWEKQPRVYNERLSNKPQSRAQYPVSL